MDFIESNKPESGEEGVYLVRIKSGMGNSEIGYHVATWMGSYWHISGRNHHNFTVTHYLVIKEPVPLERYENNEDSLGRLICYAQGIRKPDLSIPVGS